MNDKAPEEQAPEPAAGKPTGKKVKARVLVDCAHGKCNDVALVDAATLAADADKETGMHQLDADKAAVAYAESLAAQG